MTELTGEKALFFLPDDVKKRYLTPGRDKAYEVFQGVFANDTRMLAVYANLRQEYERLLVADETVEGVYRRTGITDNIWKIGCVQGMPFNPRGTNPYDAWKDRTAPLFANSTKRMAWYYDLTVPSGPVTPQTITVNRFSSLGMPSFAKDELDKARVIGSYIKNVDTIADLLAANELGKLRKDHDIVFCYSAGERNQAQTIIKQPDGSYRAKPRVITDFFGKKVEADSEFDKALGYPKEVKRCRSRVVNVATMALFPLRLLSEFWSAARKARFPFTFKHTSPSEYARRLSRFTSFMAVDVSLHDQNVPLQLIEACTSVLGEKLGPAWAAMYLAGIRMPQLTRNDHAGEKGVVLRGDIDDFGGFRAWPVNPSGHPCTSITAGDAGTFYMCDGLMEAGEVPDTKEGMMALLEGRNKHWAFINGGDNNLIGGPSTKAIREINELISYVKIEESSSFLGSLLFADEKGARLVPDVAGYVNNLVMPGRSLNDPMKGDPIAGAYTRRQFYMQAPSFKIMDDILCPILLDHLGIDYANLPPAPDSAMTNAINAAEFFFLSDPESIYWKVEKASLPKEMLGQYFLSYSQEQTSNIVEAFNKPVRQRGFLTQLDRLLGDR